MKLLEKILVATDFSAEADDAVKAAAAIASRFGSEVHLLHVLPAAIECSEGERDTIQQTIDARLKDNASTVRGDGVPDVTTYLREGIESEQINALANELDVNLIVIGAGSIDNGGQFYMGTTAARLRRKAIKPVWIVRPGSEPSIQRVLCPVDFSEASSRALSAAIHFARKFDAELTVLTVVQCLQSYYDDPDDPDAEPKVAAAQARTLELERFLRDFDLAGIQWQKLVRGGKPQREIVKVAIENQSDLLVMGSVGRTGIARILIGGVAAKVAQRLPCSIMTVRGQAPIRLTALGEIAEVDANFCAARKQDMPCSRFEHGQELLDLGFPDQALDHFRECIAEYDLCPNAWQNLADAHRRLGHHQEADECEQRAKELASLLKYGEIEADVRENHPLFRSIFGV